MPLLRQIYEGGQHQCTLDAEVTEGRHTRSTEDSYQEEVSGIETQSRQLQQMLERD